jgi:hypothetical protein
MYVPPPAGSMFFSFAAGMFWGAAIWGGCHWGHGHSSVNINVNRYNNFVRNVDRDVRVNQLQGGGGRNSNWQHKAEHRRGVAYQDSKVAQRYGASAGQTRVSRDQARGYGNRSTRPSAGTRDTARAGNAARPTTGNTSRRPSGGSTRPSTTNRSTRSSGSFTGSRNPSMERASSSRGRTSRSSFGGGRSGGGRSAGGRGGRR